MELASIPNQNAVQAQPDDRELGTILPIRDSKEILAYPLDHPEGPDAESIGETDEVVVATELPWDYYTAKRQQVEERLHAQAPLPEHARIVRERGLPLAELTGEPQLFISKYTEISSEFFPPEYINQVNADGAQAYTYFYNSVPFDLETILHEGPKYPFNEIVQRQRTVRWPSNEVIRGDYNEARNKYPYDYYKNLYPLLKYPAVTGVGEPANNAYIILRLCTDLATQVPDYESLARLTQGNAIQLESTLLRQGAIRLSREKTMQYLVDEGHVDPTQKNELYSRMTKWLVDARAREYIANPKELHFPYPSEFNVAESILPASDHQERDRDAEVSDIDFLPYILLSHARFMEKLPGIVPSGKEFKLDSIAQNILHSLNNIQDTMQLFLGYKSINHVGQMQTVRNPQVDPARERHIAALAPGLNFLTAFLNDQYEYFQRNYHVINRKMSPNKTKKSAPRLEDHKSELSHLGISLF